MRTSGWIFAGVAGFVGMLGLLYFLVADREPAGSALLLGTSLLASLVGTYLLLATNRKAPPPEDRDADLAEGAGVVGWFSPASLWPFLLAVGATIAALGLAFGWAVVVFGSVLTLLATLALSREGWRH